MIVKNIVLKINLLNQKRKINKLVKVKLNENLNNSFIIALTTTLFITSEQLNFNQNELIYQLREQNFFRAFKDLVNDVKLVYYINENYENESLWNSELESLLNKRTNDATKILFQVIKNINQEVNLEHYNKIFLLCCLIYLIDNFIDKFRVKNIGNAVYHDQYQKNLDLFLIQLELIKQLQKLILEISPKHFNEQLIAINLMLNPKH